MDRKKRDLGSLFFIVIASLSIACSGAQGEGVEHPGGGHPVEGSADEPAEAQPAAVNTALAEALGEVCRVITERTGDMSGAVMLRLDGWEQQVLSSPQGPVLAEFFESMGLARGEELTYSRLVLQAEEQGVPDFRCGRWEWYLIANRYGRENSPMAVTPEEERASVAEDLERLCGIAEDLADEEGIDEVQICAYSVREVYASITNELIWEAVMIIDFVPPDQRLRHMNETLDGIARGAGLDGWSCPAFDFVYRDYTPEGSSTPPSPRSSPQSRAGSDEYGVAAPRVWISIGEETPESLQAACDSDDYGACNILGIDFQEGRCLAADPRADLDGAVVRDGFGGQCRVAGHPGARAGRVLRPIVRPH